MSIKIQTSLSLFLAFQCVVLAQRDTSYQTLRQESGEYTAPIIETPSDRLFRTQVPSRWMLKLNLAQVFSPFENNLQTANSLSGTPLDVGVEYKISPALSLSVNYGFRLGYQFLDRGGWLYSSALAVEGRWYHDMKKRIKAGRGANNFNGKYFALEASISNNNPSTETWDDRRIALRYGLQQRVIRNGYFDLSVGVGVTKGSPIFRTRHFFSTDQRVEGGLAAFLPKQKKAATNNNFCEVLHCQDEQIKMLKINVFNVLDFQTNGIVYSLAFRPNIAYEHKIGRSPFSVELDLGGSYSMGKYQYYVWMDQEYNTIRSTSARWNATGELKWYYNMRKRILEGRSGNNLSGAFIGMQLNRNNLIEKGVSYSLDDLSIFDGSTVTGSYWAGNVIWGIQQRLLERGFIQVKIGAGSTFGGHNYRYEGADKPLTKIGRQNELNLVADLKVGFAF
jgi:hypothetical protein